MGRKRGAARRLTATAPALAAIAGWAAVLALQAMAVRASGTPAHWAEQAARGVLRQAPDQAPAAPVYHWYEAERVLSGDGWNSSNLWAPSGGLFVYQAGGNDTAVGSIELQAERRWAVWLRVRDETKGLRQVYAEVNGEYSYTMGGTGTGEWVWYLVAVTQGSRADLAVTDVSPSPWDGWTDAILVTDDLSFVPPGKPPNDQGFTAYEAEKDSGRGQRPAWIWWPKQPDPGSNGFFRRTFHLQAAPVRAEIRMAAVGEYVLAVNGQDAAESPEVLRMAAHDITRYLRQGTNVLAVHATQMSSLPGVSVHLVAEMPDGTKVHVVSDPTWKAGATPTPGWEHTDFDDGDWDRPWARIAEGELVGRVD